MFVSRKFFNKNKGDRSVRRRRPLSGATEWHEDGGSLEWRPLSGMKMGAAVSEEGQKSREAADRRRSANQAASQPASFMLPSSFTASRKAWNLHNSTWSRPFSMKRYVSQVERNPRSSGHKSPSATNVLNQRPSTERVLGPSFLFVFLFFWLLFFCFFSFVFWSPNKRSSCTPKHPKHMLQKSAFRKQERKRWLARLHIETVMPTL